MSFYDGSEWVVSVKGVSTAVGDVFVPIPSGAKGVLQKVKGAERAEPKPQNPIDIGMQVKPKSPKVIPAY